MATLAILVPTSAGTASVLSGLSTRSARRNAAASVASVVALLPIAPIAVRLHVEPLHIDDCGVAIGVAGIVVGLLLGARGIRSASERTRPLRA